MENNTAQLNLSYLQTSQPGRRDCRVTSSYYDVICNYVILTYDGATRATVRSARVVQIDEKNACLPLDLVWLGVQHYVVRAGVSPSREQRELKR